MSKNAIQIRSLVLAQCVLAFVFTAFAQNETVILNTDPDKAQIVSSDIDLFWKAYDKARPENSLYIFRDEYLRKGSKGLKEFTAYRVASSCELVDVIEARPKYYASLREVSLKAHKFQGPMRDSFNRLKELYPSAVFPDVYLMIGKMNSGGTYTERSLLIGVDMYGLTPTPRWRNSAIG